jgi:outer membrane protein assembly factor BamB
MTIPPSGFPGALLSHSANASAAGSGIVWAVYPYSGDASRGTAAGILRAFNASGVSKELWDSRQDAARDDVGTFAKFNAPTIANGKVYVPTFSGYLAVYGLLPR